MSVVNLEIGVLGRAHSQQMRVIICAQMACLGANKRSDADQVQVHSTSCPLTLQGKSGMIGTR